MIYKNKNIVREVKALLLEKSTRCKDCKHCTIFHSIHRLDNTTSHHYRYGKYEPMQEDIHYFCSVKKHDVSKFAQCKSFSL